LLTTSRDVATTLVRRGEVADLAALTVQRLLRLGGAGGRTVVPSASHEPLPQDS
jgi:hypothetical protein